MNREFVVDNLLMICGRSRSLQPRDFRDRSYKMWSRQGVVVFLAKKTLEHYNAVLNEIFSDPRFRYGFSLKDIEKALQEMISRVMRVQPKNRKTKIEHDVDLLLKGLQKQIADWVVIVPIENLRLTKRQLKVGNVVLFCSSEYQMRKYLTKVRRILNANPHYKNKEKEKQSILEVWKQRLKSLKKGETCACVITKGTLEGVNQVAQREVEWALSCLKLCTSYGHIKTRGYFGIKGEIIPHNTRSIIRLERNEKQINILGETTGSTGPFVLDKRQLSFMDNTGFRKLHQMLCKKEKCDLDRRILSSIHWYAKACDVQEMKIIDESPIGGKTEDINLFDSCDRFLKLIIALESLLITIDRENKRKNVSERSSYLLSSNKQQRADLQKYMKKAYDLRSKIVHEGAFVVSPSDVYRLVAYVQSVIITLVLHKDIWRIQTTEHLYQWFEKNRLQDRR